MPRHDHIQPAVQDANQEMVVTEQELNDLLEQGYQIVKDLQDQETTADLEEE